MFFFQNKDEPPRVPTLKIKGNPQYNQDNREPMIHNGSLLTNVMYKNNSYMVYNTCAFDSILVAVAMGYHDYPGYRDFIDQSKCPIVMLAKKLAISRYATQEIYEERLVLLFPMVHETSRCPDGSLNLTSNVVQCLNELMVDEPSLYKFRYCSRGDDCPRRESCVTPRKLANVHLRSYVELFHKEGFGIISTLLNECIQNKTSKLCGLRDCDGLAQYSMFLKHHLFIETDMLINEHKNFVTPLTSIPETLDIIRPKAK